MIVLMHYGGAATLADKSTRNALVQSFKDIKEGNRSRKPSKKQICFPF
jgi:hypothetical protein